MHYLSTRGGSHLLSFEEAVLTGLAPNSGLYIPTHIPHLPDDWHETWKDLSFVDLAVAVLRLYIPPDEIDTEDLGKLVEKSYSTFRHEAVTPLRRLRNNEGEHIYVLELFHGPTFAFKDVALQFLGNLFEFFLKRRNARKAKGQPRERLTVVGATSGDTGSAAIYGLRGKDDISVFILHPKGCISPIQEAQMTTITDANVHNVAVKGTFDDCQDVVKSLFADRTFNDTYRLAAVNSINWARILAQMVYYFSAYFQLQSFLPRDAARNSFILQYVVPTGNFGDILAGYYAKRMGLPMGKLVIATNENDILTRFWKTGNYEKVPTTHIPPHDSCHRIPNGVRDNLIGGGVKPTWSPAMDILVSSNFERLLWYLAYEHETSGMEEKRRESAGRTVAKWMSSMKIDGRVELPVKILEFARRDFTAEKVTDEETLDTIKRTFEGPASYIVDPHTSVALTAARIVSATNTLDTLQIVLSTAHPAKFSEAVSLALEDTEHFDFERDVLPPELCGLLEKKRRVIDVESPNVESMKAVIARTVGHRNDNI